MSTFACFGRLETSKQIDQRRPPDPSIRLEGHSIGSDAHGTVASEQQDIEPREGQSPSMLPFCAYNICFVYCIRSRDNSLGRRHRRRLLSARPCLSVICTRAGSQPTSPRRRDGP
uniref:Uncharacterized protein n=1 Tax=Steinernema glaseri TaxID=37863 RepID=A0A1I7ZTL6_9BILA